MASEILIAYDGSPDAKAAVRRAGELFGGQPARVVAVWQSTRPVAPLGAAAIPATVLRGAVDRLDRAAEETAGTLAEEGAAQARAEGLDARATPRCAEGNVPSTIVHAAEEADAAAIVVGSRGRTGVKAAILGSVSNGVLQQAKRPVVVVRADDAP